MAGVEGRRLDASPCPGDRCASWHSARDAALRLELQALGSARVWVLAGPGTDALSGTGHDAFHLGSGVGAELALPWTWTPLLAADLRRVRTPTSDDDQSRSLTESLTLRTLGGAAWRSEDASLWVVASWTPSAQVSFNSVEDDVQITLSPSLAWSALFGGELVSAPIGKPWRSGPVLHAGAEVEVGGVFGARLWLGVSA